MQVLVHGQFGRERTRISKNAPIQSPILTLPAIANANNAGGSGDEARRRAEHDGVTGTHATLTLKKRRRLLHKQKQISLRHTMSLSANAHSDDDKNPLPEPESSRSRVPLWLPVSAVLPLNALLWTMLTEVYVLF